MTDLRRAADWLTSIVENLEERWDRWSLVRANLPSLRLLAAAARAALAEPDVCEWHRDEEGMWHTGCGHTHWHLSPTLPTGACPFECCGRKIQIT